jgi:carbon-monoxide dehydrogenase medium subunit
MFTCWVSFGIMGAIGGVAPYAIRASSVEAAPAGQRMDSDAIKAAAAAVQNDLGDDIMSDIHASDDYRRKIATVLVARAVAKAAERAQKG